MIAETRLLASGRDLFKAGPMRRAVALSLAAIGALAASRAGGGPGNRAIELQVLTTARVYPDLVRLEARSVGADLRSRQLASFSAPGGADARGAVTSAGTVVVVDAPLGPLGDHRSCVYLATDRRPPKTLTCKAARGSRPIEPWPGSVVVATGSADSPALEVFEQAGPDGEWSSHPLFRATGLIAHVAGVHRSELLVYVVDDGGGHVLTLDRTGRSRIVGHVAPFARDFSKAGDQGPLVFAGRDVAGGVWTVEALDVDTGRSCTLVRRHGRTPVPFAFAPDAILVDDESTRALGVGRFDCAGERPRWSWTPLSERATDSATTFVRAVDHQRRFLAFQRNGRRPGDLVRHGWYDRTNRTERPLDDADDRVSVVGFSGASASASMGEGILR
jgi:hypothetical protein